MTVKYVCPACHGELRELTGKKQTNLLARYVCSTCGADYPFRNKTPVLIYPPDDLDFLEVIYSGGSEERRRSLIRRAYDLFSYQLHVTGWLSSIAMILRFIWAKTYNKGLVLISRWATLRRVECACCLWQGPKFGPFWGTSGTLWNFSCPDCGSHPRHRMLYMYLPNWIDIGARDILHFAPERFLNSIFRNSDGVDLRTTTDIALADVNCLSNINHLPFLDASFNSIICIHVLEHIENDGGAMKELSRILKTGGTAVICVPESNVDKTIEFGFADPKKSHHWRDYGNDFTKRLVDAGFQVTTVTPKSMSANYAKYGLDPNERFHLCRLQ